MRALLLAFLLAPPPAAAKVSAEADRLLMEGIDAIYAMEFERAEDCARKVIALEPGHPHAYLGLAGVAWTRYVYGADQSDPALLEPYEKATSEAVDAGQAWLKTHPDDPDGLMSLGSAYGIYARLLMARREWLKGYWYGRKALQYTRAAVKADPDLVDAQLGLGMYDYYSDLYPRFVGALARIVLRGNRARGIATLERVARDGHYSRRNAQVLLVEIYTQDPYGARDPLKALAIMKGLRAEFPDSAMIHSAEIVSLYEAGRYEESIAGAREYVARSLAGRYGPLEAAKGHVMLGCALWGAGKLDEALAAFHAGNGLRWAGRLCRWSVWAHIRAGHLEDLLGRRAEALADYKLAASEPDSWGMRRLAKDGLSKAFRDPHPGRVPPPD